MTPFTSAAQKNKTSLYTILQQENTCLSQVLKLLNQENDAILSRETSIMGSLLDKKTHLLSKLEQLDKQRQSFFEHTSGKAYNKQEFSHFIKQQVSQALISIWQEVKQQLSECKKQNEINGRVISIRKENTEQILQILLGRPKSAPPTYSHLGQTQLQKRSALYTSV